MGPPGCTGGPVGPHWCACRAQARSSAAAPRRACTSCCPRFLLQEFRSSATGCAAGLPTRSGRPHQRRSRVVRPQSLTDDVVHPYPRSTEPIRAHPERVARRTERPHQTAKILAALQPLRAQSERSGSRTSTTAVREPDRSTMTDQMSIPPTIPGLAEHPFRLAAGMIPGPAPTFPPRWHDRSRRQAPR